MVLLRISKNGRQQGLLQWGLKQGLEIRYHRSSIYQKAQHPQPRAVMQSPAPYSQQQQPEQPVIIGGSPIPVPKYSKGELVLYSKDNQL